MEVGTPSDEVTSQRTDSLNNNTLQDEKKLDFDAGLGNPGFGRQFGAAMLAMKCPTLFGCLVAYSGYAVQDYNDSRDTGEFSIEQESIFNSVIFLSGALSTPVFRRLSSTFGRKWLLIFSVVPYAVGWAVLMFTNSIGGMIAGRAISGICIGEFIVSQVYLKEITTPKVFDLMSRLSMVFFALGVFFNFIFGPNLGWRQLATFNCLLPILFVPTAFSSTESPVWLLDKDRGVEAVQCMKPVRRANYDCIRELYQTQRTRSWTANSRENRRIILFAAAFGFVRPFIGLMPVLNNYFQLLIRLNETHTSAHVAFVVVFLVSVTTASFFRVMKGRESKSYVIIIHSGVGIVSWCIALLALLKIEDEWPVDLGWGVYACMLGIAFEVVPTTLVVATPMGDGLETEITSNLMSLSLLGTFTATIAFPFIRETKGFHAAFWVGGAVAGGLAFACRFLMDEDAPSNVLREVDSDENAGGMMTMKVFRRK